MKNISIHYKFGTQTIVYKSITRGISRLHDVLLENINCQLKGSKRPKPLDANQ